MLATGYLIAVVESICIREMQLQSIRWWRWSWAGHPQVLAIIDKITVHEDPVLAAQMPSLANKVTVRLKTGELLSEELGTKENPRIGLDDRAIETKFRDFAQEHFTKGEVEEALGACWTLEHRAEIGEFLSNFVLGEKS